jgi:hypothetical protein
MNTEQSLLFNLPYTSINTVPAVICIAFQKCALVGTWHFCSPSANKCTSLKGNTLVLPFKDVHLLALGEQKISFSRTCHKAATYQVQAWKKHMSIRNSLVCIHCQAGNLIWQVLLHITIKM